MKKDDCEMHKHKIPVLERSIMLESISEKEKALEESPVEMIDECATDLSIHFISCHIPPL